MSATTPDVFISYKREERPRVQQLASILADLNLDVWYDVALRAGERWSKRIDEAAHNAECIVVCWTREAAASRWVQREIDIALQRKVLVLARLDDYPLSDQLSAYHCADLSRWKLDIEDINLRQLVEGIDVHVDAPIGGRFSERIDGQNPAAINALRKLLIDVARRHQTVTYAQAFDAVSSFYADGDRAKWPTLFATLDAIADENRLAREPPLFALVVGKDTGIPGKGYFQKHCFLESERGMLQRDLHKAHLQRVYEYFWPDED